MRRVAMVLAVFILIGAPLVGCSEGEPTADIAFEEPTLASVRIGVLPTEDALPLWVAQTEGLFAEAGLAAEIITFQAAAERDAAFTAGEIDSFAGDIIAAARFEAADTGVTIATIMLGTTPAEGRFGIAASPNSSYQDLTALAGVPVGMTSGTIQEYVFDHLMLGVGVDAAEIVTEEIGGVSTSFELLMSDQLQAAALPEPFLTLAEEQGAKLLADDTKGENLSQTVLVFSDTYLADVGGIEAMTEFLGVWDVAAELVNSDPDAWHDTLVKRAGLPASVKVAYEIQTYPANTRPAQEQVEAVFGWMVDKGLLTSPLTYESLVLVMP